MIEIAGSQNSPELSLQSKRVYRPELDVIRFLAFLLVFLHHVLPSHIEVYARHFPPMFASLALSIRELTGFGLQLFFMISAFLITDLLLIEADRTGTVSVKDFFIRRTLRIWPLYLVGLAIAVAYLVMLILQHKPLEPGAWLMIGMYAVMLGNWFYTLGSRLPGNNPMTPLWSISIEEQFYLLWPWLVKGGGRRAVLWASGVMLAVAVAVEFAFGQSHAGRFIIWTSTFVEFELFAAGALLALWAYGRRFAPTRNQRLLAVATVAVSWLAASHIFEVHHEGPAPNGASIVIGFALIAVGCAALMLSVWGWTRWPRALVRLGRISYGLYVFHALALAIFRKAYGTEASHSVPGLALLGVSALLLTLGLAEASYRWLETPFLRLKERFAAVLSRPV